MATKKHVRILFYLGGCLLLAGRFAQAQNFERYRPQPLPQNPPVLPHVESPLPPAAGSDKILLDVLEALVVLDSSSKVLPEPDAQAQGIIRDFDNPRSLVYSPAFDQILLRYLGQPVSLRSLNQMSRDIILFYRQQGRPVVDVLIPEQKISGGTVQIVVTEARIGQVRVEEGRFFSSDDTARWIESTQTGGSILESALTDDLFWANQNPFRIVGVELAPGAAPGLTDVLFTVDDVFPARGYFGYDNAGVPVLGLDRFVAGASYGNLFGHGETINYQYTADTSFSRLNAHAVTYNAPLSRDNTFYALGSWAGLNPELTSGFNQAGESWQSGFGLIHNLNKNRYVSENVSMGYVVKSTNNNLEFGGSSVSQSSAVLDEIRIGYSYLERDDVDQYEILAADLWIGPGNGFSSDTNAAAFSSVRPDTAPEFVYTRSRYERAVNMFEDWQLAFRGVGQVASDRLLYSETLGFGGFDSIRGYDQRTASGDDGWLASFEFGPRPADFTVCDAPARLRPYVFMDSGQAIIINPQPGEFSSQMMISTGVGFRMSIEDSLTLRFDYGHGFMAVPNSTTRDRIHLGVIWQFGPLPSKNGSRSSG